MKDHILEWNKKCEVINGEVIAIGSQQQVAKGEIRVKLKIYETFLMPALPYELEAWEKISKDEMNEIEKIQGRALKFANTNIIHLLNNGNRYMAN